MSRYVSWIFIFSILFLSLSSASLAQMQGEDIGVEPEPYKESALRRFEIVFTVSLPFTALHSYLAVRGVEMAKQRKVSPKMEKVHWNSMGGLTFLFSGLVAFWDYMHTRGKDVKDMSMPPERPPISMAIPDARYSYQVLTREPTVRLLAMRF